ncbi:hypothetical protein [Nocardia sp. N2S4-5]|uniref:hypothetical protein n=1 Tax=Nocardia sp. N2S4-5 TaxID=3351565 RepID=UPI0037D5335D
MAEPSIDFGQAEIEAFNNAAAAGAIHYDETSVRQAVQIYDKMIHGLQAVRKKLLQLTEAHGFGGFPTGQELQQGFSGKAISGVEVIDQLIDGAMRLQEAYLRAGGLISEADHVNGERIKTVATAGGI